MTGSTTDMWAQWLLHRRFGGDARRMETALGEFLYPVRDRVLNHAGLGEHEILLDVGCGDGLIAFGALAQVGTARVIFSDISQDLLVHARSLAEEMQVTGRCEFVRAPAEDLSAIGDAAVDAVTTRSVLIYVQDKLRAFNEFFRVLKPGGRLSIFEPINRFGWPEPPGRFWGYDVTPVQEAALKLKALYQIIQPESDPMLDFDERDLMAFAEQAGFLEIHLELQANIELPRSISDWETFTQVAGNPKIPTLAEAMYQVLTAEERAEFSAYLRPRVEANEKTLRHARAFLWALK